MIYPFSGDNFLFIVEFVFWISIGLIVYIYALYPVLIALLSLLYKKGACEFNEYEPTVTLIIAARNEEKSIEKKLFNSINLEYPKGKYEIIVVSDNSTDKTNDIVKKFESYGVRLLDLKTRHGKTMAQNSAKKEASGEILIFSDANARYDKNAIHKLVRHFQNPEVAFVSGQLNYVNNKKSDVGAKENLYWKYEKSIKKNEGKVGCITGANGSIYSVRKTSYVLLNPDIISDFIEPMVIYANGGKVLYETEAVSFEDVSTSFSHEFSRRRRIILRSIYSLSKYFYLLNPFRTGILAFELISHKLLRWLCPVFMFTLFLSNLLLLQSNMYLLFFVLQLIFYILAICGKMSKNSTIPFFFLIPYYFTLINFASMVAIVDFLRGKKKVFWEPLR